MMRTTGREQALIQKQIYDLSGDEIDESYMKGIEVLDQLGSISQIYSLSPEEQKLAAITIEMIVRIECVQKGYGAFYRLKRRASLVRKYFKPRNDEITEMGRRIAQNKSSAGKDH